MTERKNQDSILLILKAIQSDVTGESARYHQLSERIFRWAADQRMTNQQFNGFLDQTNRLCCRCGIGFNQEVGQSFEIGERLPRIAQLCQDVAFGFAGFLPAMRTFR